MTVFALIYDGVEAGKKWINRANKIIQTIISFIKVEYKRRNIVCGTSASFQGDERDIMFLSLITAHNHNRAALTKPEDERRFNVAVSRAKEQVWLFHSVQLEDLGNISDLRYKLLDHFVNYRPQPIPPQKLNQVKLQYPEYYRKDESLNVVGYYLKPGDEI
ncbi:MAG: hypothetical protein HZA00_10290 [Nitrospinae bacterium]|nr:hypothetical protein [Nitrospinota bacterium]